MAYLVGGFFGFIKRAFKKVARVVGKVGGLALGVASVAVPGPAGRLVNSLGGRLAGVRSAYARAATTQRQFQRTVNVMRFPGLLSKVSPVMPGGSLAQPPAMRTGPRTVSGEPRKRRRKSAAAPRRRKRKLKFGTKAFREFYARRRRRRARAA